MRPATARAQAVANLLGSMGVSSVVIFVLDAGFARTTKRKHNTHFD
jgi:hypothetical protein